MSTGLYSSISADTIAGDISDYVDNLLIEKIRLDLDKEITYEQIRQVALEVAAEFQDAKITTFLPIFIRRQTRERLRNDSG